MALVTFCFFGATYR